MTTSNWVLFRVRINSHIDTRHFLLAPWLPLSASAMLLAGLLTTQHKPVRPNQQSFCTIVSVLTVLLALCFDRVKVSFLLLFQI